mgnify:CR=1 FL=1
MDVDLWSGDKYMDWHVGEEMAAYLKGHGCTVVSEFGNWGNHIEYGIFLHIVRTIVLMEDYMPGTEELKQQVLRDIVDKATEYLKEKIRDYTGISR